MGAEVGATTSTFGYDDSMERYLRATDRSDVADAANQVRDYLTADPEVYQNPEQYFDQVIEIDLDTLKPHLNGPFTPDLATPVGESGVGSDWILYQLFIRRFNSCCIDC
jgi:aconitate hydratase